MRAVYARLLEGYGPQGWWPAETPFEVMVGAILTQNAAWANVERAIARLRAAGLLAPEALAALPPEAIAPHIRPAGYFNVKARRLAAYCRWYLAAGGLEGLARRPTEALRRALLAVHGVGPETADDILLYAFGRPVFVIDAYTRRIFSRLGLAEAGWGYERLRAWFEAALEPDPDLFGEYHALIVRHAKAACRKRPACAGCVLRGDCSTGAGA
nr:endonuclease [Inmirania thermothiophila]